jgi:dephospho-CoA kinase
MPPRPTATSSRQPPERSAVAAAPFIGLTGAIAAGKSEALAALERLGAATLSSDAVVHELLSTERVHDLLVERWGAEVAPGGEVDRARVGAIVFGRPDELAWLEAALHPLVDERIAAWRVSLPDGVPLAVVEIPLLFETGLESSFDATIAIVAEDATRVERAGERGIDALEGRAARQFSQDEKAARATYVVHNDGAVADLEAALEALLAEIAARGEAG